jgi:hypothetical protein
VDSLDRLSLSYLEIGFLSAAGALSASVDGHKSDWGCPTLWKRDGFYSGGPPSSIFPVWHCVVTEWIAGFVQSCHRIDANTKRSVPGDHISLPHCYSSYPLSPTRSVVMDFVVLAFACRFTKCEHTARSRGHNFGFRPSLLPRKCIPRKHFSSARRHPPLFSPLPGLVFRALRNHIHEVPTQLRLLLSLLRCSDFDTLTDKKCEVFNGSPFDTFDSPQAVSPNCSVPVSHGAVASHISFSSIRRQHCSLVKKGFRNASLAECKNANSGKSGCRSAPVHFGKTNSIEELSVEEADSTFFSARRGARRSSLWGRTALCLRRGRTFVVNIGWHFDQQTFKGWNFKRMSWLSIDRSGKTEFVLNIIHGSAPMFRNGFWAGQCRYSGMSLVYFLWTAISQRFLKKCVDWDSYRAATVRSVSVATIIRKWENTDQTVTRWSVTRSYQTPSESDGFLSQIVWPHLPPTHSLIGGISKATTNIFLPRTIHKLVKGFLMFSNLLEAWSSAPLQATGRNREKN